jgi:hypothetical protein
LVYLRARFYSPLDGRFFSRDKWAGNIIEPMSFNKWSYVHGNPINRIDPTGLFSPNTIAKSYGFNSFNDLLDAFEKQQPPYFGKRWGWLALLLDAKPGEGFTASFPNIMQLYPSFSTHHGGVLNIDNSGNIVAYINNVENIESN